MRERRRSGLGWAGLGCCCAAADALCAYHSQEEGSRALAVPRAPCDGRPLAAGVRRSTKSATATVAVVLPVCVCPLFSHHPSSRPRHPFKLSAPGRSVGRPSAAPFLLSSSSSFREKRKGKIKRTLLIVSSSSSSSPSPSLKERKGRERFREEKGTKLFV